MKLFKNLSILFAFSLVFLSCTKEVLKKNLTLDLESAPNGAQMGKQPESVPNELLVKFKKGTSEASRGRAIGLLNASLKEHIHTASMKYSGDDQGILLLSVNANAYDAIAKAKGFAEIEYAEPNWVYQHQQSYIPYTNDPRLTNGNLWGIADYTEYSSKAESAWRNGHKGSQDIYIGIIDGGYMYTHEDLVGNIGTNLREIIGNKKDDDGNGYVDDIYGWDFAGKNSSVYDGPSDKHGTHVAGTIGARGNNEKGVVGICWDVKLMNAKFLGTRGGTTANAIQAVDYFTNLKTQNGIKLVATNNSWGGGGYSQGLYDAINRAKTADILFIAAAGNGGSDKIGDNNDKLASDAYPASYNLTNIISVAALDLINIGRDGLLTTFSNYGLTTVNLAAPGRYIWSTVPTSSGTSGYEALDGTSIATPHVTGAAALYASSHPFATAADIKAAILGSVTPTNSLANKCTTGGRLNVSKF